MFPNLIAWLVSAIPTTMTRSKRREEGQQLVERFYGPKEIEFLLIQFFSTGYFQTFHRGINLFMVVRCLLMEENFFSQVAMN